MSILFAIYQLLEPFKQIIITALGFAVSLFYVYHKGKREERLNSDLNAFKSAYNDEGKRNEIQSNIESLDSDALDKLHDKWSNQ